MADSGLVAEPLRELGAFNWIYLVDWIVIGVLSLFFLFYFNRLIATVLTYFIRLYSWRYYRIYLDIEALQFSPLAGRLFFKGIRYHGQNETIFVHAGYITWRYWLPRVKEALVFQNGRKTSANVANADNSTSKEDVPVDTAEVNPSFAQIADSSPCRIKVKVSGVEAFIYNRSPAYDWVVDGIKKRDADKMEGNEQTADDATFSEKAGHYGVKEHGSASSSSPGSTKADISKQSGMEKNPLRRDQTSNASDSARGGQAAPSYPLPPPSILRLFPIRVECQKAAAVLGNENTRAIITAKIDSAFGEFDASESGPLDIFKILMSFEVSHPFIQMKPNVDFRESQLAGASSLKLAGELDNKASDKTAGSSADLAEQKFWSRVVKAAHLASQSSQSVAFKANISTRSDRLPLHNASPPGQEQWKGLARYLDDTQRDEHDEWGDVEYAKSSVIADMEKVAFQFYWDIPGPVPMRPSSAILENPGKADHVNGSPRPEYGMSLAVYGGHVVYGPWADRHRVILQQIFFPTPFTDAVPGLQLVPGQTRICTMFELKLYVQKDTTLRIPFREPSKDPKWRGRATALTRQMHRPTNQGKKSRSRKGSTFGRNKSKGIPGTDVRPFAWFDITVKAPSIIHFEQDMMPRSSGYRNDLNVDVPGVDIFSSLNHALLWRSKRVKVHGDLGYPLAWNALREWTFDLDIDRLDLFLLRDHTFLLVDLIEDWSKGPLPDYYTFVPYRYILKVHFQDYKLFLNTNDANIINDSADLDDNEFVILYGKTLDAELAIPIDRFRPLESAISFNVNATDLGFELLMPSKNTLHELVTDKKVAQLSRVDLLGSYTLCSEIKSGLTETLMMEITGTHLTIHFYGFLARHLAKIKENYFGETVHFRTLEEYQELVRRNFDAPDMEQPVLKGNDLDVILDITAIDANILLPAGTYDADEHIRLHVDTADVDLRVNNYYLELMVNSVPIELNHTERIASGPTRESSRYDTSAPQVVIDGLRFFGHRLFGLPPSEPAYVSNWDVDAGSISGECNPSFFKMAMGAAQSFILGIMDSENAVPVPHFQPLHDSTFVRFACPEIRISCPIDDLAILLLVQRINGNFNDLADSRFSQRLNLNVPSLTIACVDASGLRRGHEDRVAKALAHIETSLSMKMVLRQLHFNDERVAQQEFIWEQDIQRGYRAAFMIDEKTTGDDTRTSNTATISLPLPCLPPPLAPKVMTNHTVFADGITDVRKAIRSHKVSRHKDHTELSEFPDILPNSWRSRHGRRASSPALRSSVIPLSSTFKRPAFPTISLEPDISDVPRIVPREISKIPSAGDGSGEQMFESSDEDTIHSSFMISMRPGLTAYCQPDGVRIVAQLLDSLQPKHPTQVLDTLQFQSITEVLASNSRKEGKNSLTDIALSIPQIRVRFVHNLTGNSRAERGRSDRYDLNATEISISARLKSVPARHDEPDANSMRAAVGSLRMHAQEGSRGSDQESAAVEATVNEILVWLTDSDSTSVHGSFRGIELAMASEQVEYFAQLIYRTTLLAEDFQARFVRVLGEEERRRRFLVFMLTTLSEGMSDPAFLTRPSYLIRSSPEHVRNSDSWKILSRFQFTYRRLQEEDRRRLINDCISLEGSLPRDAEAQVVAKLDSWRSWDALRVKESFVIRIVYNSQSDVEKLHDRSRVPVSVSIQGSMLKIVVDPGIKQSTFLLERLAIGLAITPPPLRSAIELFHDYQSSESKSHELQIKTGKINLSADWAISELVDRILTLFEQQLSPLQSPVDQILKIEVEASVPQTFHVILSTEIAVIEVTTPNASQELSVAALKVSVTGSDWDPTTNVLYINATLAAEALLLIISGHESTLLRLKVASPMLWIAYEQPQGRNTVSPSLKVAGDSTDLTFQTKDEVLSLIETTRAIIDEEVEYVVRLIKAHEDRKIPKISSASSVARTKPLLVNIALFLNRYTIDVALFSDVNYSTSGNIIRLSVSPQKAGHTSYQADFDLKGQSHRLSRSKKSERLMAEIEMPAINGSLKAHIFDSKVDVSTMISMEKINLEGSAVYGMLSTLASKPAMRAFATIQTEAKAVAERIKTVVPQRQQAMAGSPSTKVFFFDARAVLAGLAISADAPSLSTDKPSANLLFEVSRVYVRTSNRSGTDIQPLPFPQFRIAVGSVAVELRQSEHDQLRLAGKMSMRATLTCKVELQPSRPGRRTFQFSVVGPTVDVGAATAPSVVDVLSHLQRRMRGLDLPDEHHYLRRLRQLESGIPAPVVLSDASSEKDKFEENLPNGMISSFAFELRSMRVSYITEDPNFKPNATEPHDLVLTLETLQLITRSQAEARLNIKNLQLALVSSIHISEGRPKNSALLPEVVFNVGHKSTRTERRIVLQVAGKTLDFQLDPDIVLPANDLERSLTNSSRRLRASLKALDVVPDATGGMDAKKLMGDRNLSSLIVDADFAGSVVQLQAPSKDKDWKGTIEDLRSQRGRYGQFAPEGSAASAKFHAPGIALKIQYLDPGRRDPSLNVEFRVNGSNNELRPSVVPLILQMSDSIKKIVRDDAEEMEASKSGSDHDKPVQSFNAEESIVKADPKAILGKTKLNVAIRVCRQEFSLSCQPFAKVAATAKLEDIYITINNIDPQDKEEFFAVTAAVRGLSASLQHVYSRTITASFDIESIVLSLMNSKHLSGSNGISAILKVDPTKMQLNAKQLQDMLLFREIWLPPEIRNGPQMSAASASDEPGDYFMHRYQQVAASTAFSWNATVTFKKLSFDLDLGQSIGRTSSSVTNLWMTSTKTSKSRQNLCVGIDDARISSAGRLSGFVALEKVKVRTSIAWPYDEVANKAPLIQGSVGFEHLCVKAAFDYQAFAVADITSFEFIMYNVREAKKGSSDRLVAILDGDKINVYCIASSAAFGFAIYQAFERLIQEKETSYYQALQDIEMFLRRKSTQIPPKGLLKPATIPSAEKETNQRNPLSLHTDVVVTLRSLDVGAFPSTLLDNQVLKGDASDVQARFAVVFERGKLHSGLGLTLGQLRVALADVPQPSMPKTLGEISVNEVTTNAHSARGGVIFRVPRVVAAMQTWQKADSNNIDYVFRSSFEGKIDVGWNYSRISFIRGMYSTHTRTLASRLGKPLPEPAVRIKGAPAAPSEASDGKDPVQAILPNKQQKITAEVTLPQSSKYTYHALEPPIIETPQLRDMGEATPPLEWVGLQRDRLPNVTHQIVIVTLVEIAKEVEEAYLKILGSA